MGTIISLPPNGKQFKPQFGLAEQLIKETSKLGDSNPGQWADMASSVNELQSVIWATMSIQLDYGRNQDKTTARLMSKVYLGLEDLKTYMAGQEVHHGK